MIKTTKFTKNYADSYKEQKMRYRIQNIVILEELENGDTVRDIVYEELTEQEFLIRYLADPDLVYWAYHDDGSRDMYRKGKHYATIHADGTVTNIPGITAKK